MNGAIVYKKFVYHSCFLLHKWEKITKLKTFCMKLLQNKAELDWKIALCSILQHLLSTSLTYACICIPSIKLIKEKLHLASLQKLSQHQGDSPLLLQRGLQQMVRCFQDFVNTRWKRTVRLRGRAVNPHRSWSWSGLYAWTVSVEVVNAEFFLDNFNWRQHWCTQTRCSVNAAV